MARAQALLAALWAGQLLTVALLAAPNAFATLARPDAAAFVARLFTWEARFSLGLGLLLLLVEQRRQRDAHEGRIVLHRRLWLPLLALLATLVGEEVLRPMMDAARASGGFALLHGASMACYLVKTGAVLALAWTLTSSSNAAWASRA